MQDVLCPIAGVTRNIVTQTNKFADFAEISINHLPNISGKLLLSYTLVDKYSVLKFKMEYSEIICPAFSEKEENKYTPKLSVRLMTHLFISTVYTECPRREGQYSWRS
jgi:hypothetical protein